MGTQVKFTSTALTKFGWQELANVFERGRQPRQLDGFYRGKLLATRINPLTDFIMGLIKRKLMPWKGKSFISKKKSGVNIISRKALFLVKVQYPSHESKENGKTAEIFPFKFTHGRSVTDKKRRVYLIKYDNPKNPPGVRRVVDEVIEVGKDLLLGRAQLKTGRGYKTVAYFTLQK